MPADTPASEQSVYFDAPMMHIFTKNKDSDDVNNTPDVVDRVGSSESSYSDEDRPITPPAGIEADVRRQPSVAIARSPVIKRQPSDEHILEPEDDDAMRGPFTDRSSINKKASSTKSSKAVTGSALAANNGSVRSRRSSPTRSVPPPPITPRTASPRSSEYTHDRRRSADDAATASVRGSSTLHKRASVKSGAFARGAGTIGPAATPARDDALLRRQKSAELELSDKQKVKLMKEEAKEGKKLSKVLKSEGKAEKESLATAVKELADLQGLQKNAAKDEVKSHKAHAAALKAHHKVELAFMKVKAELEAATTTLKNEENMLESTRQHAQMVTEMVQEKNREVEELRLQKKVDDRERQAKLTQLVRKA